MWLLYVTFEDFVCLKHPNKSGKLLSTGIDISTYVSSSVCENLFSSPRHLKASNTNTKNKGSNRSKRILCEEFKKQCGFKPIQAELRSETPVDKTLENNLRYSCVVSYQIAKIQSLKKTERRNKNRHNRQKHEPDGAKNMNSMDIGQADQWNLNGDKMHDFSVGQDGIQNQTVNTQGPCRSPRCVNSLGSADKAVNSQGIVSGPQVQSHGVLLRGCGARQSQNSATHGEDNRRCQRYNPQFRVENRCLNQSADQIHVVGRCVRNPARVETTHCGPRIVNVKALQAITDNALKPDPCITNKLSVQSKCWNSLRLQGILPLDNCKFDTINGPMSDRIMTDPLRVSARHNVSFTSQDGGYLHPRPDSVVPKNKPPRTLSLDCVNMARNSGIKTNSAADESVHDVSVDMSHSNESSPVTISSGYESDSIQTCEADIDKIFFTRNKANNASAINKQEGDIEALTDYFSMSDSNLNVETPTQPTPTEDITPTASPVVMVTRTTGKSKENTVPKDTKLNSKSRKVKQNKVGTDNNAVFSPKERNSYQLTKVARTMFEIIHDLQYDENSPEGKKKGKRRRNTPPLKQDRLIGENPNQALSPQAITAAAVSTNGNQIQGQISGQRQDEAKSMKSIVTKAQENDHFDRILGNPPKVAVRCLRRPLGADPSDFDRHMLPHSDSARAPIENLQTQTSSQPSYLEEDVNDKNSDGVHWIGSGTKAQPFCPNLTVNSRDFQPSIINKNWTTNINDCAPYATTRLPGCQTPRRDAKDDHVYETIPGDELLSYEEHMRLRMNGIPVKIQRVHPDFPFVPYEPPALPARNGNKMPKSNAFMNSSFIMHNQSAVPQNFPHSPRSFVMHTQPFVPQISSLPPQPQTTVHNGVQFGVGKQPDFNSAVGNSVPTKNTSTSSQQKQRPFSQQLPINPLPVTATKQKRPVSEQLSQAQKAPAQRRLQLLQKQQLIRQQQQLQLLQQKQQLEKQRHILQQKQKQEEEKQKQHQKQQYLLMRDINSNIPERASFSATSTVHNVNKCRSRSNSWDGYGTVDLRKEKDSTLNKTFSKFSTSDLLDYIDDIKQPPAKRRENFYLLLSNKQNRMDFSESLEIESKLRGMGIGVNRYTCSEFVDEDGYTTMDGPPRDLILDSSPQFLQSTYV